MKEETARTEVTPPRLEAVLAEIEPVAATLRPPPPHERRAVMRSEAAELLDRLLTRVARGRGALDVVIGEALADLSIGDRTLQLGYCGIGDYARERLGIAGRTAFAMARLGRQLRDRPLLRAAVFRGEVSARKAQTVAPLARGEAEAEWTARAQSATVRALEAAVRATVAVGPEDDEPWDRICVLLKPEARSRLDEAMELAAETLGPTSTRWERLEALCQEYLGSHPAEITEEEACVLSFPEAGAFDLREVLEAETQAWAFLEPAESIPVPEELAGGGPPLRAAPASRPDPQTIDARLRELVAMRDRWDELVGHLGMLLRMLGLWRDMKFVSFGHYCAERLGMAARTVEQRVALERRLYALPALRAALREGRVSYEQARLVAQHADEGTVDGLIARAEVSTCIRLRRALEGERDAQMCARGDLDTPVPRTVRCLLEAAIRAVQAAEGRWLPPGECLAVIAEHCLGTWSLSRPRRRNKVRERDRGLCQVPGCSRPGGHSHHIVHRSHQGDDTLGNLVSVCAAHHLHAIHRGWITVVGRAPDRLVWRFAVAVDPDPVACPAGSVRPA